MNYPCELIKDLLPLYQEQIASCESRKAVEEHLQCCSDCKKIYETMCRKDEFEKYLEEKELRAAASYQNLRKKLLKKIGKSIAIIVAALLLLVLVLYAVVVVYLKISAANTLELYTDISVYNQYRESKPTLSQCEAGCAIWPETITERMTVTEYTEVYYCPFDSNYYGYLSLTYEEDDYEDELVRLSACNLDDYTEYYGATGFEAYEVLAMDASNSGFVYALSTGEKSITYIEIIFPGYAADLDVTEYIPVKYLPEGLDISEENPMRMKYIQP